MTNAQTAFKNAFRAARSIRAEAAKQAEYCGINRCLFVSQRFEEKVRRAVGYPNIDATTFHAAGAAALVVATQDFDARNIAPSLAERLEASQADDCYAYN